MDCLFLGLGQRQDHRHQQDWDGTKHLHPTGQNQRRNRKSPAFDKWGSQTTACSAKNHHQWPPYAKCPGFRISSPQQKHSQYRWAEPKKAVWMGVCGKPLNPKGPPKPASWRQEPPHVLLSSAWVRKGSKLPRASCSVTMPRTVPSSHGVQFWETAFPVWQWPAGSNLRVMMMLHEKPREVFLQPRFSRFPNSAPSQKQFPSAESREVKVSPANPFRSVFHPNQTKILFIYHSIQSFMILGFTPYAEAEKKTKTKD